MVHGKDGRLNQIGNIGNVRMTHRKIYKKYDGGKCLLMIQHYVSCETLIETRLSMRRRMRWVSKRSVSYWLRCAYYLGG